MGSEGGSRRSRRARLGAALLACLLLVVGARAGAEDPPSAQPDKRYLFYLHGAWIEEHGLVEPNPAYGRYQYEEIKRALSAAGFTVISEARSHPVEVDAYAHGVVRQVRDLVAAGVPEERIVVAGHSKGGKIALRVASELALPRVRFVIMAGCPKPDVGSAREYAEFVANDAPHLEGHILSLYDSADVIAASCGEAFAKIDASKAETREIVLTTGKGHGLFYAPSAVWIDEVVKWAH